MPRIDLRGAVIVIVLAATAVPIELRPLSDARLSLTLGWIDILQNLAGFLPVGIALGGCGTVRAVAGALLLSAFAETSQLFMQHRDPSLIDVVTNTIGAALGVYVRKRCRITLSDVPVTRWHGVIATAIALGILLRTAMLAGEPLNPRGWTEGGRLEAYWRLGESFGRVVPDSSGQGHEGTLRHEAQLAAGLHGRALHFDGASDYIDFGTSAAFRLTGSMTISAWVNSSRFPRDDAVILSTLNSAEFGYQLDTTIDRGPRTIGFKLGNMCGNLMARYGATALVTNRWYHVAGVYDAEAKTLDVYLNGRLDNGFITGEVTCNQRASRSPLYIGRRGKSEEFDFIGLLDEVRIYSFALTRPEIAEDMQGTTIRREEVQEQIKHCQDSSCRIDSDPEDKRLPVAVAAFGVLIAIAWIGLGPHTGPLPLLAAGLVGGLLFLPATVPSLPMAARLLMPLISLVGSAAVAFSMRR